MTGGDGGAGGAGTLARWTDGLGGAGIIGSNLTITNSGTIAGGLSGDGVTLADAITFTGGANTLIFTNATSGLTGDIGVNGGGSLTFDQSGIDTTVDSIITGDGSIIKAGSATIILDGVNTYTGGTTVNGGTLRAGVGRRLRRRHRLHGQRRHARPQRLRPRHSSLAGNGGTVALGGADLLVDQAGSTTFSGVISDTGAGA